MSRYYRRFDRVDRVLHACLMSSFLGLSVTGLPLFFSHEPAAALGMRLLGGFRSAGRFHRAFAALLLLTFAVHLGRLLHRLFIKKEYGILWGPGSMVPQPRDAKEMLQHLRYFIGKGPRPKFDRFTYWEKFDYWAVFWGMGIIGTSGLFLWFPRLFSKLLPGTVFNVAAIVHGEEALLAVVFIFTVHFFNGHLRPEKFPMDTVIFTGVVPEEELKHERPAEYERLVAEGKLAALEAPAPPRELVLRARIVGTVAVTVGIVAAVATISALLKQ